VATKFKQFDKSCSKTN